MTIDQISQRSESHDLRGGRFGRKLYSVSWGLCPITMIANMDVLRKCGIESIPEVLTFDEWEEICKTVYSSSNGDIYAYGLPYDDGEADFLRVYQFMQAFGGEFASSSGELLIRSPENIKALDWLKTFCKDGKVKFDSIINIRKGFVDDKVAFMHDGPWSKMWLSEMVGEKFDTKFKAVLNPVYTVGKEKNNVLSRSWNYNHALAVPSQSNNVASAIKVIDAITLDPEISGYYYEQSGHLPVNNGIYSEKLENSDFYKVFSKQLEGSDFINAENEYFPKAMDFCIDAVHNIFMKDAEVATELAEKQHYLEILYGY